MLAIVAATVYVVPMNTPTHPQDAPNIGACLKVIREGAGLSLSELARRVGKDKSTISRFESGERVISDELRASILRAIADHLLDERAA